MGQREPETVDIALVEPCQPSTVDWTTTAQQAHSYPYLV